MARGHHLRLRRRVDPGRQWGCAYAAVTSLNSGAIDVRTVSQPQGTGEQLHSLRTSGSGSDMAARSPTASRPEVRSPTRRRPSGTAPPAASRVSVGTLYKRLGQRSAHRCGSRQLRHAERLLRSRSADRLRQRSGRARRQRHAARRGGDRTISGAHAVPDRDGGAVPALVAGAARSRSRRVSSQRQHREHELRQRAGCYARRFAARLGWANAFQQDAEGGLTAGAGFNTEWQNVAFHVGLWVGGSRPTRQRVAAHAGSRILRIGLIDRALAAREGRQDIMRKTLSSSWSC